MFPAGEQSLMRPVEALIFFQNDEHPALVTVELEPVRVAPITDYEGFCKGTTRFGALSGAEVQFMAKTVAGGHNCLSCHRGKGLEGRLDGLNTVACVESAGVVVQDIGAEIELLIRVGRVTGQ
jgi:hypothetical protein